jgi:hypothetical protein
MKKTLLSLILVLGAFAPFALDVCAADEKPASATDQTLEAAILVARIGRSADPEASIQELEENLRQLPSVKLVPHSSATPMVVVQFDPAQLDVGDLAQAVGSVKTPGADPKLPAAGLLVTATVTKAEQAKVRGALAKVKGVNGPKSEVREGEVIVVLKDEGGARLKEIHAALQTAGFKLTAP